MFNKKDTIQFLTAKGFKLKEEKSSEYFGDYYELYTSLDVEFIFNSSKSNETVDVRKSKEKKNIKGYDLALVKALLFNESELDKPITIEEYCELIQTKLDSIIDLFRKNKYQKTKNKLDDLRNQRMKQMFPYME